MARAAGPEIVTMRIGQEVQEVLRLELSVPLLRWRARALAFIARSVASKANATRMEDC